MCLHFYTSLFFLDEDVIVSLVAACQLHGEQESALICITHACPVRIRSEFLTIE